MKNKSYFYKLYIRRLIFRIVILLITIGLYILYPNTFLVAKGFNFFKMISPLHIIWFIWMLDMILQLCRVPKYWPLGSQKYREERFKKPILMINKTHIKRIMKEMNKDAVSVAIAWILLVAVIDILYLTNVIHFQTVIIISTAFYVCDVICIIGWCPFKTFFMHNKCCTTCRIFNWDHAMMFTPLIAIPGIWTYSLVIMSLIVVIVWETACSNHPERFMEKTNISLRCNHCKDKLCGKNINDNR